jgi:Holliday junction resolvase RusA-like endonuclease
MNPPAAFLPDTQPRATALPSSDGGALSSDRITIVIDMPMPPSTNRIWRYTGRRMHKSKEYTDWLNAADMYVLSTRQYPKRKIHGPFLAVIRLNRSLRGRSDGDNRIKAVLDWAQSRDLVRDDSDCLGGMWRWCSPSGAPQGCRLTLWSVDR